MRVRVDQRGPQHHGVVVHARAVARLIAAHGVEVVGDGGADVTHAQFTDALWGSDINAAASEFEVWAAGVPRPLVVTLHDLPGADPDPGRERRRSDGYARVAAAADATVVSSRHEAARAGRLGHRRATTFIDLPLPPLVDPLGPTPSWDDRPTLGVLGFVYPGKGHAEVIEAASRQTPTPRVVSLGAVSPGHDALLRDLERRSADLGVDLVVTGRLSDAELAAGAAEVTVPVVPGTLISASASLLTWLAARRRPVCADGAYIAEIAVRHPSRIERYGDRAGLDGLVSRALLDPGGTRLTSAPDWPDVGAAHVRLYADLLGEERVLHGR